MRSGLLFVGCHGMTASTFLAGVLSAATEASDFGRGSYWWAIHGSFPVDFGTLAYGGWDWRFNGLREALQVHRLWPETLPPKRLPDLFPAVLGPADYAVTQEGGRPTHSSFSDAVATVRRTIESFRDRHALRRVVVLNTGSPMPRTGAFGDTWSAVRAYATGAVLEGADWVEFTPSDSIDADLLTLAHQTGSRLAGRDGSTGQTILKAALREFFSVRGLRLENWYSTNLIGNHDGQVLSHPDYRSTKIEDKAAVLARELEHPRKHQVEIAYVQPAGDNKESWDCIHFSGFLGRQMSLRLNWQGADSFLAASLLLDVAASLLHAEAMHKAPGLLSDIGLLFKRPLGEEGTSFTDLVAKFRSFSGASKLP